MPRLDIVRAFVEQSGATKSNAELLRLLEDAASEMGFRYFAMVHHVDLRRASSHIIRLENYPESWASYFVEHGLFAEDPIHQACLTSNMGFAWADVSKRMRSPAGSAPFSRPPPSTVWATATRCRPISLARAADPAPSLRARV